ncbi:MAG: ABC transporter permease [Bryobacteraceae bacterium]
MAWHRRLRNLMRPGRLQNDLERELAFHVTERADDLRAAGLSSSDALLQARRRFGNYSSQVERTRDMDIHGGIEAVIRNVRQSARALRKTPAFTAAVVATLALGIGANSAVFSAVYAVLLRPLPLPHSEQLVTLAQVAQGDAQPFVAPVRLEDWNRLNSTFQAISGYYAQDDSELSGSLPEKLRHAFVAPRFLQVWGVAPELGRDFSPQEEHFGGPSAVLISGRFWRRRFGADPNVVGKTLRIGRTSIPIIGVMPASFLFPERDVDLWSASPSDAPFAQNRTLTWFNAIGRLKAGATLAQALANLATVQANLGRQFPEPDSKITVSIRPLKEATIGGVRKSLWILFGSVSLLLLIACTNVAALLLTRAAGRRQEIAVRFSLGASRVSVVAQLLTEALILSLAGALFGLAVAAGASAIFRALAKDLPRIEEIGLDWRIVGYTLLCSVAAALACGILPAIRSTRRDLAGSLAQAGRAQVGGRNPVQFVLIGVQVALAVTLLAGAGLLLRSLQELGHVSPGFDPSRVLTFHISTSWAETNDFKGSAQRLERLLDALRSLPGVEAAASSLFLPGVASTYQVELRSLEGRPETEPKMLAQSRPVTAGYFTTMHIPLLAGELCREQSTTAQMMVNRSFANTYLNGGAALGRHLDQPGNAYVAPTEIRGIVGDAREVGLDHEPVPTVYWCYSANQPGTYFLVRTHGDPRTMVETVRRKVHEIEPQRSVYDLTPLTEHISDAYAENRMRTILLAFFAATAIALACVGLYGTLSYLVSMRQREVGLRLALGAMRTQIVRQFLTQGLRVSLAGCVAGIALAAAFTRLLAGMLYGVSAWDAPTLAGVVMLVMAVSVVASLLPAIRAARLEPMQVLRDE